MFALILIITSIFREAFNPEMLLMGCLDASIRTHSGGTANAFYHKSVIDAY
jgi:hypothetical protein